MVRDGAGWDPDRLCVPRALGLGGQISAGGLVGGGAVHGGQLCGSAIHTGTPTLVPIYEKSS